MKALNLILISLIIFMVSCNGKKKGGTYSITYNYKYGWTAGYEDSFFPSSDNEECENLAEAVSIIEGWIEYAQDSSNDW